MITIAMSGCALHRIAFFKSSIRTGALRNPVNCGAHQGKINNYLLPFSGLVVGGVAGVVRQAQRVQRDHDRDVGVRPAKSGVCERDSEREKHTRSVCSVITIAVSGCALQRAVSTDGVRHIWRAMGGLRHSASSQCNTIENCTTVGPSRAVFETKDLHRLQRGLLLPGLVLQGQLAHKKTPTPLEPP